MYACDVGSGLSFTGCNFLQRKFSGPSPSPTLRRHLSSHLCGSTVSAHSTTSATSSTVDKSPFSSNLFSSSGPLMISSVDVRIMSRSSVWTPVPSSSLSSDLSSALLLNRSGTPPPSESDSSCALLEVSSARLGLASSVRALDARCKAKIDGCGSGCRHCLGTRLLQRWPMPCR